MKVLFVSCRENDYLATCLAHGLSKLPVELVLAQEMYAYDALAGDNPCNRIVRDKPTELKRLTSFSPPVLCMETDFDLMIVNACFLRDFADSVAFVNNLHFRMKPGAKFLYVEGWDSFDEVHEPWPLDNCTVFRREVGKMNYPYHCHNLPFAAPAHWFDLRGSNDRHVRPVDVFYAGHAMAAPERWDCLSKMFQTQNQWKMVAASCGIGFDSYFDLFRTSKLAVCPVGAAGCFDCLRTWEAVSHGCIPVFVGWPDRVREPWFSDGTYFVARTVAELPELLDRVLALPDLEDRRTMLLREAWEKHTTLARVRRMLELAGVKV